MGKIKKQQDFFNEEYQVSIDYLPSGSQYWVMNHIEDVFIPTKYGAQNTKNQHDIARKMVLEKFKDNKPRINSVKYC